MRKAHKQGKWDVYGGGKAIVQEFQTATYRIIKNLSRTVLALELPVRQGETDAPN